MDVNSLQPKSHWICRDRGLKKGISKKEWETAPPLMYLKDQLTRARLAFEKQKDVAAELYINRMFDYEKRLSKPEKGKDNFKRLMASAYAVRGRIYKFRSQRMDGDEPLDLNAKASEAFSEAYNNFETLWDKLSDLTSHEYSDYGVSLYHMDRYAEAFKIFQTAFKAKAVTAETNRYIGLIFNDQGRYDDAEVYLRKYLTSVPNDTLARKTLANAIAAQEWRPLNAAEEYMATASIMISEARFETSLEMLESAWEQILKSNHDGYLPSLAIKLLGIKGEVLLKLGRYDEALLSLDRALENDSNNLHLLTLKGITLYSLSRYWDALQSLDQAQKLDDKSDLVKLIKGFTLLALNRYDQARIIFEDALERSEENICALWGIGEILRKKGRYEEALANLDKALKLKPSDLNVIRSKGHDLLALGQKDEALDAINRALESDPNNPWLLTDRSMALISKEHYDAAMEDLNSALKIDPKNPWALKLKGKLLCDFAEYHAAVQVLGLAINQDPYDDQSLSLLGWALEQQGSSQASDACKYYEAALELNPDDIQSHIGLANVLLLLGSFEKASKKYQWIIEKIEKDLALEVKGLSSLGWCYYRLGDYDKSIRLLINALAMCPYCVSIRFDLALVLFNAGNKERALREYRRGLDLANTKHNHLRRGIISVALKNLVESIKIKPDIRFKEAYIAKEELSNAIEVAKKFEG